MHSELTKDGDFAEELFVHLPLSQRAALQDRRRQECLLGKQLTM